jgi:uncharacterized repeat protein (TIGR01451 family)
MAPPQRHNSERLRFHRQCQQRNHKRTTAATGEIGGAASFNGSTNYIGAATAVTSNTFTLSGWIYLNAFPASCEGAGIFYQGTGSNYLGTELTAESNCEGYAQTLTFRYEGGTYAGAATNAILPTTWQHVAATYNAGTVTFYVNGASKGFTPGLGTQAPAANPSAIGYWDSSTDANRFFNGLIDEIEVSGVARTAGWLATEYNNQSAPSSFFGLSAEQTLYPVVAQPTFSPTAANNIFTSNQTVTISTITSGATIHYTTDGSTPTETSGAVYTTPLTFVSGPETLKAMAYAANMTDSLVATATIVPPSTLTVSSTHSGSFIQGQNGTYTITASNANQSGYGATSSIVTVTETVPSGMTPVSMAGSGWSCISGGNSCTTSSVLAPGASYPPITVTVSVASNAPLSAINQVSVSGGGSTPNSGSDPTTIVAPDFTITLTPTSTPATVMVGGSATFTVAVSPINAFNGTVTLSAPGLPSGAAATFPPATITGSGTSTLTYTAPAADTGNLAAVVNGTSGSLIHSASSSLAIQDFTLTLSPAPLTIQAGTIGVFAISVTGINGFNGAVGLNFALTCPLNPAPYQLCSTLPQGSYVPASVAPGQATQITIPVSASATPAIYYLGLLARSGTASHNWYTWAQVSTNGDYTISTTSSSQTVSPPNSASFGISNSSGGQS